MGPLNLALNFHPSTFWHTKKKGFKSCYFISFSAGQRCLCWWSGNALPAHIPLSSEAILNGSYCHYVNKSCMIPGYIISPLWNIFTNDEMLLLSVSDIQSLSVSFMTALIIQADLGQLQGDNFQYKVKWAKFLPYPLLNHFPFLSLWLRD